MFESRENELLAEMARLQEENKYHSVILFITDIIKEGSKFLVVSSDENKIEEALKNKLENKKVYVAGIMSRKKQVVPMMMDVFDR